MIIFFFCIEEKCCLNQHRIEIVARNRNTSRGNTMKKQQMVQLAYTHALTTKGVHLIHFYYFFILPSSWNLFFFHCPTFQERTKLDWNWCFCSSKRQKKERKRERDDTKHNHRGSDIIADAPLLMGECCCWQHTVFRRD